MLGSVRIGAPLALAIAGVLAGVEVQGGDGLVASLVRLVEALAAAVVIGPAIAAVLETGRRRARLLDVAGGAAVVWTLAAAAQAVVGSGAVRPDDVVGRLTAAAPAGRLFSPGGALLAELGIVLVLSVLAFVLRSRVGAAVVAGVAMLALAPTASLAGGPGDPSGGAIGIRALAGAIALGLLAAEPLVGAETRDRIGRILPVALAVAALAAAASLLVGQDQQGPAIADAVLLVGALVLRRSGAAVAPLVTLAAGIRAALPLQGVPEPSIHTSPAVLVTGTPLPPDPTVVSLLVSARLDLAWLLAAAGALAWLWATRARRPLGRTIATTIGLLLVLWLTNGGAARYEPVLFGAHDAIQASLATVVPPLLIAAMRPALPRPLRRPVVAGLLLVAVVGAWSVPPLLGSGAGDGGGRVWWTGTVLAAGCLLALASTDARAPLPLRLAVLGGVALLLAALQVGDLASGLLLPYRYGAVGWPGSALARQQVGAIAGLVLTVAGLAATAVAAVAASRSGVRTGV